MIVEHVETGTVPGSDVESIVHLEGPRPSKEFPLHGAFYRRDPAPTAVVHLHSRHGTPWDAAA
ncbi:class II aldolase/adducin family protein [Saccharopolyspora sp. NPDC047091]|uniref:class II aldolase/adducin family protein n=1 Tax=Saccharopolyspora sp. NPDC047091 TaxID=3155924 RepID=UPI00340AFBF4